MVAICFLFQFLSCLLLLGITFALRFGSVSKKLIGCDACLLFFSRQLFDLNIATIRYTPMNAGYNMYTSMRILACRGGGLFLVLSTNSEVTRQSKIKIISLRSGMTSTTSISPTFKPFLCPCFLHPSLLAWL